MPICDCIASLQFFYGKYCLRDWIDGDNELLRMATYSACRLVQACENSTYPSSDILQHNASGRLITPILQ